MSVDDKQILQYMKNMKKKFPISGNKAIIRDYKINAKSYIKLAKEVMIEEKEIMKNLELLSEKSKDVAEQFIDILKEDLQKK